MRWGRTVGLAEQSTGSSVRLQKHVDTYHAFQELNNNVYYLSGSLLTGFFQDFLVISEFYLTYQQRIKAEKTQTQDFRVLLYICV